MMAEAAAKAIDLGKHIFLATGSKDLVTFLGYPGANQRDWFVRVAPEPGSLENALALGIPRGRLFAVQGPCSREHNEVLWKDWQIDCVVTKESGAAGGFGAKAEAARSLGISLIVVKRPRMNYPAVANDFDSIIDRLQKLQGAKFGPPLANAAGSPASVPVIPPASQAVKLAQRLEFAGPAGAPCRRNTIQAKPQKVIVVVRKRKASSTGAGQIDFGRP